MKFILKKKDKRPKKLLQRNVWRFHSLLAYPDWNEAWEIFLAGFKMWADKLDKDNIPLYVSSSYFDKDYFIPDSYWEENFWK